MATSEQDTSVSEQADTQAGQGSPSKHGDPKKRPGKPLIAEDDLFLLDRLYPKAHEVFSATSALEPTSDNVAVALDTNVLLLPYYLGKGDLTELGTVYKKLAEADRLFLPERVAREFIKHRDRKIADMVHAIDDRVSKIGSWGVQISPLLLEGLADGDAFVETKKALDNATKAYSTAMRRLSAHMRAWRGNDPVTELYATLFVEKRTVGPSETKEKITEELEYSLKNKVPPGYKDGNKDDLGIGDVVIWLSLLNLGRTTKKDLVFVTGEEKADWFVRSGNQRLYPRPELIDSYRQASGGCSLRLSSLHELLKEMSATDALVADVKNAERTANNAIQAVSGDVRVSASHTSLPVGRWSFDYSTNDGMLRIGSGNESFDLAFSKCSDHSIYLLKRGTTRRIARVKQENIDLTTTLDQHDTSSSHYTINLDEGFLVENSAGAVLAGRILGIKDDSRGADQDEVEFIFAVIAPGARIFMP